MIEDRDEEDKFLNNGTALLNTPFTDIESCIETFRGFSEETTHLMRQILKTAHDGATGLWTFVSLYIRPFQSTDEWQCYIMSNVKKLSIRLVHSKNLSNQLDAFELRLQKRCDSLLSCLFCNLGVCIPTFGFMGWKRLETDGSVYPAYVCYYIELFWNPCSVSIYFILCPRQSLLEQR